MESLITKHRVREHDFISGKPKTKWFDPEFMNEYIIFRPRWESNPCSEITLGIDPIDNVLSGGYRSGELGLVMSPPANGRSYYTTQREPERRVVNLDFASLYDRVQVSYDDIRPEGYENWTDIERFAHKIMLNSSY